MFKILIVGDSLAGGWPHQNFPHLLKKMLPRYQVIARPSGGQTLIAVGERAEKMIGEILPHILVIEAGTNDLLLPALERRGGSVKMLAFRMRQRGYVPIEDPSEFKEAYAGIIDKVRKKVVGIVLTTIPCVGEDLSSELNQRRKEYNQAIRELANERNLLVADVAERFQRFLGQRSWSGKYLLDSFIGILLDPLRCSTKGGAEVVSRKRGLLLTVDGVHLNPQGAFLFAETVFEALSNLK